MNSKNSAETSTDELPLNIMYNKGDIKIFTFRNWEQKMIVPLTWQLLTLTITLSIIRDVMDGVKTCNNELRVQN